MNLYEFQGEWKPKQIKNPKYKGEWKQKEIPNPEYVDDPNLYKFENVGAVGFDLWQVWTDTVEVYCRHTYISEIHQIQVKAGTIFDNILVTDDVELAKKIGEETFGKTKGPEKKMREKQEEEERKKEEEEEKKRKEKEGEEFLSLKMSEIIRFPIRRRFR